MKNIKIYLVVFILSSISIGCNKKQSQNMGSGSDTLSVDSLSSNLSTKTPINLIGTYKGHISCDDCEYVELTLKNNKDYNIILHLSAEEKTANSVVKESGKYSWNNENSILSLDKYNLQFKVIENKLYYLDHSSEIDQHEVLIKE